jgi:photosystem II stability/assembly factor-like uncharacterized protein
MLMITKYIIPIIAITLLYLSLNNAKAQWVPANGPYGGDIGSIAVIGNTIFVGTLSNGIYRSTDNGNNWVTVNAGLPNATVTSVLINGTSVYAAISGSGIFKSDNNGNSWTPINIGLADLRVSVLATNGTYMYAGTSNGYMFLSVNNGASWTIINNGISFHSAIR